MYYYQYHIGDNLLNTIGLSMTEEGAYRRLIDMYYSRGRLPKDFKLICRLTRATKKAEVDAVRFVLAEFFEETEDGYINIQVDQSLSEAAEKSEKARNAVAARWNKNNNDTTSDTGSNTSSNTKRNTTSNTLSNTGSNASSNTIQYPISNNHKPIKDREENSFREEESVLDEKIEIDAFEVKERAAITTYARSQGIQAVGHQGLDELIAQGATMQHFVDAIPIGKSKGKSSWRYILGIVRGMLDDSKNAQVPQQRANPQAKFDPVAWVRDNPANQQHGLQPIGNFIDVPFREVSHAE